MIKTWQQRCEDHEGIVTNQMILDRMQEEIDELRQALAQPEQEPVGYVTDSGASAYFSLGVDLEDDTPLYTAPPKRDSLSWVGLTDADIAKAMHGSVEGSNMLPYQFARAIEAKLKEKNSCG